jgi:UvrD/REP helicase N-terminal domain/UvrD-like helicase C-terminal domain
LGYAVKPRRDLILETADDSQQAVIDCDRATRLVVDAGPGTGKTAVACARIRHLIANAGVNPTRIWMISFTRTAVSEIRGRLAAYVGEDAYAVRIATVDSHAWAMNSGHDERATLTGSYEENIERVLTLLSEDEDLRDYVAELEHLIIDEAQDLVGIRADLVGALIEALSPDCGVTVFCDEAQAIYGFSEDDKVRRGRGANALPLTKRLLAGGGFSDLQLHEIHRTRSRNLRAIFSDVRQKVLAIRGKTGGLFEEVRNRVEALADRSDLSAAQLSVGSLPQGTLVLFRRRAEALMASQFCDAPHSLRLSGFPPSIPPWFAICFSDFQDRQCAWDEFAARWQDRIVVAPGYDAEEGWARLRRIAGEPGGTINMHQLRRALGRSNPPPELVIAEYGLPGPIVGTIHASKGREADEVLLMMPRSGEFEDDEEEREETRVLFVGSTRARRSLKVGKAITYPGSSLPSGRAYRLQVTKHGPRAMIEIGRAEDIAASGLVGRNAMPLKSAETAQLSLRQQAETCSTLVLRQLGKEESWNYALVDPEHEDRSVGRLTSRLRDDLWEVAMKARERTGKKNRPPSTIRYVRVLGSRSIVLPPDDPQLETLHEPWARSGFLLAPRIATFTKAYI